MSIRTERVASVIREQLSSSMLRDVDTHDFGMVTITDVMMTPDLRIAKIYVSHYGSGKNDAEVLEFLEENTKMLRMAVGRSIRLKFTPELRFYIDQTMERVERLDELFRKIHEEEDRR